MNNKSKGDVSAARKILKEKGVSPTAINPVQLAAIANQLNKSLEATLNLIAFIKSNGVGFGPFPQTAKVLTGEYS